MNDEDILVRLHAGSTKAGREVADKIRVYIAAGFGSFGSRIQNSLYLRSYCNACGAPMRVGPPYSPKEESWLIHTCHQCQAALHPGHNCGDGLTEPSPWMENAIRAWEEF